MSPEPDIKTMGAVLHQRLINGDELAVSDLCDHILPTLKAILRNKNPMVDDHLIHSAVTDAFLSYVNNPLGFDPTRGSLISYLQMSSQRDLQNALETLRRREKVVELRLDDPEYVVRAEAEGNIEQELIQKESLLVRKVFELVKDKTDRQIIALMMDGVRDTKEFAEVLGITHLSEQEQQAEVKRNKDRIKVLIKRKINPKGER